MAKYRTVPSISMPPRFCAVHIDTLVPTLHPDTWIPLPVRGVPIPLLYTSFRVSPIFLPPVILTCTYNLTFPPVLKIDTTVVDTTKPRKSSFIAVSLPRQFTSIKLHAPLARVRRAKPFHTQFYPRLSSSLPYSLCMEIKLKERKITSNQRRLFQLNRFNSKFTGCPAADSHRQRGTWKKISMADRTMQKL